MKMHCECPPGTITGSRDNPCKHSLTSNSPVISIINRSISALNRSTTTTPVTPPEAQSIYSHPHSFKCFGSSRTGDSIHSLAGTG